MAELVEKVILGNGTEITGFAGKDGDGALWITVKDQSDPCNSVMGMIMALSAEGAADRIEYLYGDREPWIFIGYTEIDTVKMDSDGYQGQYCSARLRRPERE